jgi:hypothetical protein
VNVYSGSAPITLAICGDPVVGRALLVLLRSPRYEVRLLSVSSLSEPTAWVKIIDPQMVLEE